MRYGALLCPEQGSLLTGSGQSGGYSGSGRVIVLSFARSMLRLKP